MGDRMLNAIFCSFFLYMVSEFLIPVNAEFKGIVQCRRGNTTVPMPGIGVSNGREVVKTDQQGRFLLPDWDKARFIMITVPSGHKAHYYQPVDRNKPDYSFIVEKSGQDIGKKGEHSFIQMTDTEIFNTDRNELWADDVKGYALKQKAAFIIHTGDICYEKGLREHKKLINSENAPCPVYYAIGNHDLVKGERGEALFEGLYGPVWYSFDVGNVHYVVTPMLSGDFKPGYSRDEVAVWLKNDLETLAEGKSLIIFNHDLLTSGNEFVYGNGVSRTDLSRFDLKAWIYGHWHINLVRRQGSVLSICTTSANMGGIDHSTAAFRVIKVEGDGKIGSELRHPYIEEHDETVFWRKPGDRFEIEFSVNAYDSTSQVESVHSTFVDTSGKNHTSPLFQKSDWNWRGSVVLPDKAELKSMLTDINLKDGRAYRSTYLIDSPDIIPSPQAKDNWNNLLGNPAHFSARKGNIKSPPRLSWSTQVGASIFMTSPVINDGCVYGATVDENLRGEAFLFCLDIWDGREIWKMPLRNSVKNTIVCERNTIFAQDVEGNLYAVDKITGKLLWEQRLHTPRLPALVGGLASSNGIIYAGFGKGLSAWNGETGEKLWSNTAWDGGEGTTSTFAADKEVLIASAQWKALYGQNPKNGELLWTRSDEGLRNRASSGTFCGESLFILSENKLWELDSKTGKTLKVKELSFKVDVTSSPLVSEDSIIFGTSSEGVVCLDRGTWEQKWSFKPGNALVYTSPYSRPDSSTVETSPVFLGRDILFGASDGCLYLINEESGECLWQFTGGAPFLNSPALSGNTFVCMDFAGNVYAFVVDFANEG